MCKPVQAVDEFYGREGMYRALSSLLFQTTLSELSFYTLMLVAVTEWQEYMT
jgi:hypothetical protein